MPLCGHSGGYTGASVAEIVAPNHAKARSNALFRSICWCPVRVSLICCSRPLVGLSRRDTLELRLRLPCRLFADVLAGASARLLRRPSSLG